MGMFSGNEIPCLKEDMTACTVRRTMDCFVPGELGMEGGFYTVTDHEQL
jgi:hypothetical protein